MKEKLALFLKENYETPRFSRQKKSFGYGIFAEDAIVEKQLSGSVNNYIENNKNENKFQKLLFMHIDKHNLKDSDVYNKVNIDRRLFSKIRSDKNYHPSKETVILLAIALELNEDELDDLLLSASYSLPKNNYFDLIIRFCFKERIFDLFKINEFLEEYDCKLLV